MATVTRSEAPSYAEQLRAHGETRILLQQVPWDLYEALRDDEVNNHVHMTYLDGELELMTTSQGHERYAVWFGLFIIELARVFSFTIRSCRCTTWQRKGRGKRRGTGKEADDCFYIASHHLVRHREVDLKKDPPPDLAVEVELSESAMDIMEVYSRLRVPEVWRFDGESLSFCVRRDDGSYHETSASPALPFLRKEEVTHWLERAAELDDDAQFCEEVRAWAREVLLPRRNA
jgi:Uma2 family endonuclease